MNSNFRLAVGFSGIPRQRLVAGYVASPCALSATKILGANDRVRIGAIGTGGRTRYLMGLLKNLPGNDQIAVCDVYEPNLEAIALLDGSAKRYGDYRQCSTARTLMRWSLAARTTGTSR